MSEQEVIFLDHLEEKYDRKYHRMQTFLLAILGIFLSGFLIIGGNQMQKVSENTARSVSNEKDIKYIIENSPSKKAIDRIIQTIDNQAAIQQEFFPDNIKEGMIKMNEMSRSLRADIMKYNADLTTRGGGTNGSANSK